MELCSRLTAAEGGARLAAAAGTKNIMITEHTGFIPMCLLIEYAHSIRGPLSSGFKRSVYITRSSRISCVAHELKILTDVHVLSVKAFDDVPDWRQELEEKQVLVGTSTLISQLLKENLLTMANINVLIVDSCHLIFRDIHLQYIMKLYKDCDDSNRPRILAMTYPLFQSNKDNEVCIDNKENHDKLDDCEENEIKISNENINNEKDADSDDVETEIKNESLNENPVNDETLNCENKESSKTGKIDDVKNDEDDLDVVENDEGKSCGTDHVIRNEENDMKIYDETKESKNRKESVNDNIKVDEVIDDNVYLKDVRVCENFDDFEMYKKIEWKIEEMEKQLCCEMDLAEDIDGGKRLSPSLTKPKEVIVEFRSTWEKISDQYRDLESFMRNNVNNAMQFINEHRYDPTEIYGDELYDEFMNIPHPSIEPKQLFRQFLFVLDELGPYAADKAAFSLLTKLEKLKIKVPYERHFLLLCLCTSVFVKIRCYADLIFSKYESDWEKLSQFSTPKVLRFAAILEQFRPDNDVKSDKCDKDVTSDHLQGKCETKKDGGENNAYVTDKTTTEEDKNDNGVKDSDRSQICEQNKDTNEISEDTFGETPISNNDSVSDNNQGISDNNQGISDNNQGISDNNQGISDNNQGISDNNQGISNVACSDKPSSQNDKSGDDYYETESGETNHDNKSTSCLKKSKTIELLDEINTCDFISLGDKIEDRVNVFECDLKEIEERNFKLDEFKDDSEENVGGLLDTSSMENTDIKETGDIIDDIDLENQVGNFKSQKTDVTNTAKESFVETVNRKVNSNQVNSKEDNDIKLNTNEVEINDHVKTNSVKENVAIINKENQVKTSEDEQKVYKRGRGRGRRKPNVKSQPQTSDSLCGIVFMNEPLMAKIMFMIIVDMSRSRPSLSHLCAQYCAVESAQEPKENQRQGKMQEDVLKKFRMHECNLLLATSALEEGIDLPRCNLVVRWDIPPSYRSYGLCRSRARASKSSVTLLANAERYSSLLVHNLAVYKELDQIVTRKCGCGIQYEPPQEEEMEADSYTSCIDAYKPNKDDNNINIIIKEMKECIKNEDRNEKEEMCDENKKENKNKEVKGEIMKCIGNLSNISVEDCKNNTENIVDKDLDLNQSIKQNVGGKGDHCSLDFRNELCKSDTNKEIKGTASEVKITYDIEKKCEEGIASVDLNSAIALINRYCGKLPSDTFTRLAPQWWMEEVRLPAGREMNTAYICTLRMPLNCPVKYNIVGHPMPTRVLARRMVALQACRILHKSGELDDQLMPIGKENFKAADMESNLNQEMDNNDSARPGTTKRRQYYYKRTAWAFTDCQPIIDTSDAEIEANPAPRNRPKVACGMKRNMLHAVVSNLWCALPERYNTRGRKLHLPQHATQAIGILVARYEPTKLQIPSFPVYTRSGEVRVSVEPALDADVRLSPRRAKLIRRFMRFVFSDVLRVRRRGMKLQTEGSTQNNYFIVPTVKRTTDHGTVVDIDWSFLELIFQHTEEKKIQEQGNSAVWEKNEKGQVENPLLKLDEKFVFDPEKYSEAVVTPWYRNQDQPQFFLVAEICWQLTPDSTFPSEQHDTFRSYYKAKYGAELSQTDQPLLDVDHTSARLNLLTPRYVNRKGVALPVSSERTRRAKRDRLDQKQIMVPELCKVHPFAAPLWFATVALPCVLYRINALLIADEIRRAVALDVGLGITRIDDDSCPGFTWPPLDFGWSLAEVLNADSEKHDKKKEIDDGNNSEDMEDKEQSDNEEQEDLIETEEETEEPKEKTINDILQEKEEAESGFEIGTWSNEMASSIPQMIDYDEFMEPLPPNLTFCTSATGGANWSDPIDKPKHYSGRKFSMADSDCSYLSSDFDTDDSDFKSDGSDEDSDGFSSSRNTNAAMGVRIEYKTAHEAEAVDVGWRRPVALAPAPDAEDDIRDLAAYKEIMRCGTPPEEHLIKFQNSVILHEKEIVEGHLITKNNSVKDLLPDRETEHTTEKTIESNKGIVKIIDAKMAGENYAQVNDDFTKNRSDVNQQNPIEIIKSEDEFKIDTELIEITKDKEDVKEIPLHATNTDTKYKEKSAKISEMFPYLHGIDTDNGQITLEVIEKNKRRLLSELKKTVTDEEIKKLNCFSMVDIDIDATDYVNEKVVNIGFDCKEKYQETVNIGSCNVQPYFLDNKGQSGKDFDFDYQPSLEGHPGPSPSVILQALTMSNANDGINLERLETIGDSFLKFAITVYLYCAHPAVHEGKLSHMRSKQVSNLNLYRLGRNKRLGARMIASKFEPHDNWLPPCHKPPPTMQPGVYHDQEENEKKIPAENTGCFIPYNLITQHSIPDKSIADCVEALIGAYLLECGPRGALLFMSWLGIRVLPCHLLELPTDHPYVQRQNCQEASSVEEKIPQKTYEPLSSESESCCSSDEECAPESQPPPEDWSWPGRPIGSLRPYRDVNGKWVQPVFGELKSPPSPLLRYIEDPEGELEQMLSGYEELEKTLQYRFRDRSLLLQALTHASHQKNRLTDCYQRLEFLGDAILDYLITRHLYEDPRRHSPGALTDLRSALVNNTIFATLAARHGFHKYFRHMSPGLNEVLMKYVKIQEENGHSISEEHYLIQEDEMEQAEDVEVPKALGDLFESVAGAIFLDSGMSLGAVWRSYARLMMAELEAFSAAAPKSPVRELLEAEPDTAKFGKPERLADGRRVRVCVEVFGRGTFKGIGRNYRIAKGTAARCALRHLKIHRGR